MKGILTMDNKKRILWITRTAILIALLIVLQAATAPLGVSLITGSMVNLVLVVSVMVCGLSSGLAVAVLSPVIAKLLGIGPLWTLIPFIGIGNIILILLWHFIGNRKMGNQYTAYVIALFAASIGKFLTLYIGIAHLAVSLVLHLPEKQAEVISNTFSVPQLITAMIGGALAIGMLPLLKKAILGQR